MTAGRSVVINGDLGSGKSTVSKLLAERIGVRRVSIGDLYREMAAQRGMTTLELNIHAELDDKIDHYVDRLQSDIAASGDTLIVDSRLAWHFFKDALKVHLITDPRVAANRALGRPATTVESYTSTDEALARLAERSESERVRFIERYGVDKTRLRNYDVVCDSTRATPGEIVEAVLAVYASPKPDVALYLDPARLRPLPTATADGPVALTYDRPDFLIVSGTETVDDAIKSGSTLIPATLADA